MKAHWSSDDDTIGTVENISTRQIQDIKKGHERWPKCATWAIQIQISPNIFRQLVWPIPITVCDLP